VQPITIAAGAFVAQVCVIGILFLGLQCLEEPHSGQLGYSRWVIPSGHTIILLVAVITLAALALSASFQRAWAPLVAGNALFSAVPDSFAMVLLFVTDIAGVSLLVAGTGGSQGSPFQAVFFLVPTLALFLHEPPTRVVIYTVISGLCFSLLMVETSRAANRFAYWLVSMTSLALAVYIGISNAPR
jgi:hypothetical protein